MASGDKNPIPLILAIVATRFWLSLIYVAITSIEDTSTNFLGWLGVFTLGVIPEFPTIVNVLLVIGLDGSLIVWLTLLLKRIANPVAN